MNEPRHGDYTEEQIQRLLTEDPRVAEQGIVTTVRGDVVVLCGEVESTERRRQIERLVAEQFPGARIHCDIAVTRAGVPEEAEELR